MRGPRENRRRVVLSGWLYHAGEGRERHVSGLEVRGYWDSESQNSESQGLRSLGVLHHKDSGLAKKETRGGESRVYRV